MSLNFLVNGSGSPCVWLHGLLGSANNFAFLTKEIPGTHYLLDLRNHGKSFWDPDCSYEAMAGDVRRFLSDQGLERVTVIGHSMGGKTAIKLACEFPTLVDQLVLIDSAPVDNVKFRPKFAQEIKDGLVRAAGLHLEG
jgi:esterase